MKPPKNTKRRNSKRLDPAEEKLQQKEAEYLKQRTGQGSDTSESEESSCGINTPGNSNPRPFSDLMNSVLITSYNANPNLNPTPEHSVAKNTQEDSEVGALTPELLKPTVEYNVHDKIVASKMEVDIELSSENCKKTLDDPRLRHKPKAGFKKKTPAKNAGSVVVDNRVMFKDLGGRAL